MAHRGPPRPAAPCDACGKNQVRLAGVDTLHGNLSTPASDTEVEHTYVCDACGHRFTGRA